MYNDDEDEIKPALPSYETRDVNAFEAGWLASTLYSEYRNRLVFKDLGGFGNQFLADDIQSVLADLLGEEGKDWQFHYTQYEPPKLYYARKEEDKPGCELYTTDLGWLMTIKLTSNDPDHPVNKLLCNLMVIETRTDR